MQDPNENEPDDDDMVVVGAGLDLADPNSPLAPLYFRTSHVVLAVFLAVLFAAFTHLPVWHTDVWAHLRFGEEIVRHEWPRHEPFPESFADKGPQYIHYQWLAQAGAYLVYEAGAALSAPDPDHQLGGGALMLVTVHALIVCLRLLLLYLAFQRLTGSPPVALLGVLLVAVMGAVVHLWILRPQILGELAFAAVLLPLSRPLLSRRALIAVPLVFLVWANCHGSFAMGFLLLGAVAAGRAVEVVCGEQWSLAAPRAPRERLRALFADLQFRRLALLVILSVLATMVNPHGPLLLVRSYTLSQNPNIPTMEEWKPLPYGNEVHTAFLASVVLLAVLLRLSPRRFTPAQLLLLVGFGLQSVAHARMVVWWIMVFAWVAVPHLHAVAARYRRWPWLDDSSVPSLRKTVLAVGMAVVLLLWSRPAFWLFHGEAPTAEKCVTAVTPRRVLAEVRAAEALRGPEWQQRPCVIFCSETLGDYLLWDAAHQPPGPPIRLSCYTHVHLFTPEHWAKCVQVKNAAPGWQSVLDDMGADFIVLEDDLYEQTEHRNAGKTPGIFNLIDRVKAEPDRWQVISEPGAPVFVAQRVR
jgi:hypothetical protein